MSIDEFITEMVEKGQKFCLICDLCKKGIEQDTPTDSCDHHKNGYCALFRLQAAKDMLEIKSKMDGKL